MFSLLNVRILFTDLELDPLQLPLISVGRLPHTRSATFGFSFTPLFAADSPNIFQVDLGISFLKRSSVHLEK